MAEFFVIRAEHRVEAGIAGEVGNETRTTIDDHSQHLELTTDGYDL